MVRSIGDGGASIRTGTTPTHIFTVDVDCTEAEALYVTYEQYGKTIIEKTINDVEITSDSIIVPLSQQDTLSFSEGTVAMQIRVRFSDGNALKSNIIHVTADKVLKEGII